MILWSTIDELDHYFEDSNDEQYPHSFLISILNILKTQAVQHANFSPFLPLPN